MKKMYNSEIKQRYIEKKESDTIISDGALDNLFNRTMEFEENFGKDLSCFTYYEIEEMYKTWNSSSFNTLQVQHSSLTMYTDWCINNSLVVDFQNHFREFNREKLTNCLNLVVFNSRVFNREQILEWCNDVYTKNPSDAFILLALFEGIRGDNYSDIANLKMSDFNAEELTVRLPYNKKTVKISQQLYNYAKKADETLVYHSLLSNAEFPLLNDDLIIKNKYNAVMGANEKNRNRRVEKRVKQMAEYFGLDNILTTKALIESGVLYYVIQKCKETGLEPYECIKRYGEEIEYQFDYKIIRTNRRFCDRYKEYLV